MKEIQELILSKPFRPEELKWRVGRKGKNNKAQVLAYVDSRDVQDRFDEAVGKGNWKSEFSFFGERNICRISILIDGEWVYKEDGAGDTRVEGEKGGISDAFKRAAVMWGINRAAYGLKNCYVQLNSNGYLPDDIGQKMAENVKKNNKHYLEELEEYEQKIDALENNQENKENKKVINEKDTPQLPPKDLLEELEIFINTNFEKSEAQEKMKKVIDGLKKYEGNEAKELSFLNQCDKALRQKLS